MTLVNCHASYRYAVKIQVPNASNVMAAPVLGAITGIQLRLAATPTGAALNGAVGTLATIEATAGQFYCEVSKALHETYVLPLGKGTTYYAIWSKGTDFDMEHRAFTVSDGTTV